MSGKRKVYCYGWQPASKRPRVLDESFNHFFEPPGSYDQGYYDDDLEGQQDGYGQTYFDDDHSPESEDYYTESEEDIDDIIEQDNFAHSSFKAHYRVAVAPDKTPDLSYALQDFLMKYCRYKHIATSEGVRFCHVLVAEVGMESKGSWDILNDAPTAAQRLWSSDIRSGFRKSNNKRLYSILNEAIRKDLAMMMRPLAVVVRCLNQLCLTSHQQGAASIPPNGTCFRGGGLPEDCRGFFSCGQKYRVPAYLSTSFSRQVAQSFVDRAEAEQGEPPVLWIVRVDTQLPCLHAALLRTSKFGEDEYLFVPYSVFTVTSVRWAPHGATAAQPHEIEILASPDNKAEPEDLPLAPWS